ncbi:hypothetical protein FJZ39_04330 [Candidatus Saccharibacteria bacterium]|nr:hypothetical protein [Candidatus Saccharibacteria bacterium]
MTTPAHLTAINLSDTKTRVSDVLDPFIRAQLQNAAALHPRYGLLWESIQRLTLVGGKRLRPYLVFLGYQAAGGNNLDAVTPIATAHELLHLSMLVHDDIIDRDDVRYGIKNVSGQYLDIYAPYLNDPQELRHYATTSALLAGDLLLVSVFTLMDKSPLPPDRLQEVRAHTIDAFYEVVGGELLDTEAPILHDVAIPPLLVNQHKTASYSCVGPLLVGAAAAGASEELKKQLADFGQNLGIAFQLTDDLLGTFGNSQKTGKSTSGDILEGKRTYLAEQCRVLSSPKQLEAFNRLYGNHHSTPEDIETVRRILTESGAKTATEKRIEALAENARAILNNLQISESIKRSLYDIVDACTHRDK